MSSIKDLDQYVSKKDLSKTAKEKIVNIFFELNDATIEETVTMLLRFPQDVIGNYLIQTFDKKSEAEQAEVIISVKKVDSEGILRSEYSIEEQRLFIYNDGYNGEVEVEVNK